MKFMCWTVAFLVVLAAAPGFAQSYLLDNALRSMSVDDDERMYSPVDVTWDSEGLCYLLFQGSCQVLVLNEDYEVIREFGACGEGPGEIGKAKTIEILGDHIYVFQDFRLDIFDLNGGYLGRKSIGRSITDTGVFEGRLIASSQDSDSLLTIINRNGEIVGEMGPPCNGKTWDEKYVQCGGYKVTSDQNGLQLIDGVSAKVFRFVGDEWVEADWGIPSGKIWNKGGAVYTKHAIAAVCGVPGTASDLVVYREAEGAERSSLGLVHQDAEVYKLGDLDVEANVRRMAVSPKGELWVLFWGSEIRIFNSALLKDFVGR